MLDVKTDTPFGCDLVAAMSSRGLSRHALMQLFDHLPEVVFFMKDSRGRYTAANQTFAERVGVRNPAALIGRCVSDFYPPALAQSFEMQDREVLQTGRPILNRLEHHWHGVRREGWCLTTKLPLRDERGNVTGLIGISRDLRTLGNKEEISPKLTCALNYLEHHYAERITPAQLAEIAGLSAPRFARCIKRIFCLSPMQLIMRTRLAAATRLLKETNRSIAEIAMGSGFYDHSAFTQAFRNATGFSPTRFRMVEMAKGSREPDPKAARGPMKKFAKSVS